MYPDSYAGAYVDYDILVIQLTDISYAETSFYTDLLGANAPIRFEEVRFSMNELNAYGEEWYQGELGL